MEATKVTVIVVIAGRDFCGMRTERREPHDKKKKFLPLRRSAFAEIGSRIMESQKIASV